MANIDVFIGNDTRIDPDIYQLWLSGYSAQEAASLQQRRGILQQYGATFEMVLSDIQDHYRVLGMLERYMKNPESLSTQLELQISPDQQNWLVEQYYEFDKVIVREILGKKVTSRYRNQLDEISEKSHVSIKSCGRQFDNVKHVLKTVEEMNGSLIDNIRNYFLLSRDLSQQYAAVVFILNNRFDLSKKKLGYLEFSDFVYCANMMITHWSCSSKGCTDQEDNDLEIDRDFLQTLREMRGLSDKEVLDEHKISVCKSLQSMQITSNASSDIESNFKNVSKMLLSIAYGLTHSKELRDLFLDLLEKFVEPWKQANWSSEDVRKFFEAYRDCSKKLPFLRSYQHLIAAWDRYLNVISSCVIQMYHS